MKVEAVYTPTVMGGPVVRFRTGFARGRVRDSGGVERTDWSAEISASRDGVSLRGAWPMYSEPADLATLRGLIAGAWNVHGMMRDAGHSEAYAIAKDFVAMFNAGKIPRPAPEAPAAPPPPTPHTHAGGDRILSAHTLALDSCVESHAVIVLLLDAAGKPFAEGHVSLEHVDVIIGKLREIRDDLGGALVGRG
jgi:hypothetical protein